MTVKRAYRKVMIDRPLLLEKNLDSVPADLLIPERLIGFAQKLRDDRGEWRDLIAYLVNRHRPRILLIGDKAGNLRFRYQEKGLNLTRICYAPYRDVIAQLRILSYASRISMCALIVLMLEWERAQERDTELDSFIGVPIECESGWRKAGAVLRVFAGIQMPAVRSPP